MRLSVWKLSSQCRTFRLAISPAMYVNVAARQIYTLLELWRSSNKRARKNGRGLSNDTVQIVSVRQPAVIDSTRKWDYVFENKKQKTMRWSDENCRCCRELWRCLQILNCLLEDNWLYRPYLCIWKLGTLNVYSTSLEYLSVNGLVLPKIYFDTWSNYNTRTSSWMQNTTRDKVFFHNEVEINEHPVYWPIYHLESRLFAR